MVVAVPPAGRIERATAGDHGAGRHQFVDHLLFVPLSRSAAIVEVDLLVRPDPLVQPDSAVAEAVVGPSLGPAMNPSSDIDM